MQKYASYPFQANIQSYFLIAFNLFIIVFAFLQCTPTLLEPLKRLKDYKRHLLPHSIQAFEHHKNDNMTIKPYSKSLTMKKHAYQDNF